MVYWAESHLRKNRREIPTTLPEVKIKITTPK